MVLIIPPCALEFRHVSPEKKSIKQVDPDQTNAVCQDDEAENNAGAPPAIPRTRNPDVASGRARNPDSIPLLRKQEELIPYQLLPSNY